MKSTRACALLGLITLAMSVPATTAAAALSPSPNQNPAPLNTDLRAMTWNIHHAVPNDDPSGPADLERIAAVIRAENPDIVTLNEVHDDEEGAGSHGHQPDILKNLLADDGYAYTYFGVSEVHDTSHPGTRGEMILSKYPISDPEITKLSTQHAHPGEPDRRALVKVNVDVPGSEVARVYVTHMSPPASDAQILDQRDQATEIVDTISGLTEPVIFAGDLNVRPTDVVRPWFADDGLVDTWTIHHNSSDGVTRPNAYGDPDGDNPDKRIDYVYASPRFDVVDTHVSLVDRNASDHLAVVADIRLRTPDTISQNSLLAGASERRGWAQLSVDGDDRTKLTVCKDNDTTTDDGWDVAARLYKDGQTDPYVIETDGGTSRDKCNTRTWTGNVPAVLETCSVQGDEVRACRREAIP